MADREVRKGKGRWHARGSEPVDLEMGLALLCEDDGAAGGARDVCVDDTVLRYRVVYSVLRRRRSDRWFLPFVSTANTGVFKYSLYQAGTIYTRRSARIAGEATKRRKRGKKEIRR